MRANDRFCHTVPSSADDGMILTEVGTYIISGRCRIDIERMEN